MIEKGRHMKIDRTYRFCPLSLQKNVYFIENEFSFSRFNCPVHADIRERYYIDGWLTHYISEHLFVQIDT